MKQFFLEWLPAQLERLEASQKLNRQVSVLVAVGDTSFTVHVSQQGTSVTEGHSEAPTFRVVMNRETFERLVLPAQEMSLENVPALKLLSLDDETIELIAGVPGALEVRVKEGERTLNVVFGPGSSQEVGCTVECELTDLQQVQAGKVQPLELLMNGKLRLDGDPQIAMALGGVLL